MLSTQTNKPDQQLVFFLSELVHGTISSLPQDSVDDRLLEFRRDVWSAEDLNHAGQWVHKVFHEMLNPAWATAEVPLQTGSHDSPTKSRPIAHGNIRVGDAQHTLLNQIHDLFVERRLESVPNMTGKFLSQVDGLLTNRCIEGQRLLDCVGRCLGSSDYFDQRNKVRRIERMLDEDTLGVLALRLHNARRYPR